MRNIEQYKQAHKSLFWYTPENKKSEISDSLLVETILNYGTLNDVRELIAIMGKRRIAEIFFASTERQKQNYYPEIYNFFSLIFSRYAQRDFK